MAEEIIQLRMQKPFGNLFTGEAAGFPRKVAEDLVKRKVGVPLMTKAGMPELVTQAEPEMPKKIAIVLDASVQSMEGIKASIVGEPAKTAPKTEDSEAPKKRSVSKPQVEK